MAEIRVEKKSYAWIWWLLALILLALLLWWMFAGRDEPEVAVTEPGVVAEEPAAELEPLPGAETEFGAQAEGIPFAEILGTPADWAGRSVTGEVRVAEVVSDRGFWVEDDQGQRLFVLLNEVPGEIKEINAGQRIRMVDAQIYDDLANVPGEIDDQARQIIEGQPAVLVVDSLSVEILEPGV
jgi:hypothetical protein